MATVAVLPNPVFEGSEKRIELQFKHDQAEVSSVGLRELKRDTLNHLMSQAACEIVSKTSNDVFDAYVLSESSLFVHPTTWVLKTCGATQLLSCLPVSSTRVVDGAVQDLDACMLLLDDDDRVVATLLVPPCAEHMMSESGVSCRIF